jgi:hypothetical protein
MNNEQVSPSNDQDDLDRRIAAAHCARAVVEWCSPTDRSSALAHLANAMARTRRVLGGRLPVRRMDEFLSLLGRPMGDRLGVETGALMVDGAPSMDCEDLLSESGSDPEAELVQRRIGIDTRALLRRHRDGEAIYRAFRRFLIDHPIADEGMIVNGLRETDLPLAHVFEKIPASHRAVDADLVWPCPRCGWPMRVGDDLIACDAMTCRRHGARLGHRPLMPGEPIDNRFRLRRGVWRYTLLPGLTERDLGRALEKIGAEVEMWPYLDAYDLDIRYQGNHWRVDVKDWADPAALWRNLSRLADDSEELWILVPDHRRWQLEFLRRQASETRFRLDDLSGFVRKVREAAK